MALRNIDTKFYKEGFIRLLSPNMKLLYSFMMTDCEADGIWTKDFDIANVYIGVGVCEGIFAESFVDTGKVIDLGNGKYFLPEFIEMQYPKGLNEKNPSQTNIIARLKGLGLLNDDLTIRSGGVMPLGDKLYSSKEGMFVNDRMLKVADEALKILNDNIEDGLKIVADIEFDKFASTEHAIVEAGLMVEEYKKQAPKKKAAKAIVEQVEGTEVSSIQKRKDKFRESLLPYVEEFGHEMIFGEAGFYEKWTEPTRSGNSFKMELQPTWSTRGRLVTWRSNDKKWSKPDKEKLQSDYDKVKNL